MAQMTFISIGECMAELQLANAGLYSLGFGGDTLNTAWYVRALTRAENLGVEYFTAIGGDQLSQNFSRFLADHDIGGRFIKCIPDRNIGLYLISLKNAERSFTYWRNASAAKLLADDVDQLRNSLAQAQVIYFSGVTLAILAEPQRQIFLDVLLELKSTGKMIVFDSNARRKLWPSIEVMRSAAVAAYKVATVALPTFDDDHQLFGDSNPAASAARIAGYGVNEIVVKDGSNPSLVMTNGSLSFVSPNKIEDMIDTTGAGDSFNAGYIAARINDWSPVEAAKFAHHVAGRVICGRGALIDMKIFSDLQFRLQKGL